MGVSWQPLANVFLGPSSCLSSTLSLVKTSPLTSAQNFPAQSSYLAPAHGTLTPFLPSGPLSELHYPIDSLTKKPKGFAFVTFMFPEHAVKAYAEVDGQVFQVSPWAGGRLVGPGGGRRP